LRDDGREIPSISTTTLLRYFYDFTMVVLGILIVRVLLVSVATVATPGLPSTATTATRASTALSCKEWHRWTPLIELYRSVSFFSVVRLKFSFAKNGRIHIPTT
jgi:hypothetical protein